MIFSSMGGVCWNSPMSCMHNGVYNSILILISDGPDPAMSEAASR